MNRRYSVQEYSTFIDHAMKRVPKLGLGTDVMVGFPGETDEAFGRTRSLLVDLPFAYFHVFSYSPRPRTASLKLAGSYSRPPSNPEATPCARSRETSAWTSISVT